MIRCCFALLLFAVSGQAAARTPEWSGSAQVRVEITRRGNEWTADYLFDREYPVWVFPRTDVTRVDHQEWRPLSWTVETRGVRLERRGWYDVLTARGDVPKQVRIRFTPFTKGLQDDYTPALQFTDGSVALYVAQFDAFPMESVRAVKALPSDLNNQFVPDAKLTYVLRDQAGPVWLRGKRLSVANTDDKNTYVFFGKLQPIETPAMVGFVDPQLPEWIRGSLAQSIPDILARYTQELGAPPGGKPTIMLSWAGPTPRLTSRAGSVLPGLIVLTYEGSGVLSEDEGARVEGLQFIAHEAAHFWLGQTVAYEYARDAWITEGGADLLAMRLTALEHAAYDWRDDFNKSIEECVNLTKRRGVEIRARPQRESRVLRLRRRLRADRRKRVRQILLQIREKPRRRQPCRRHRDARRVAGGARRSVEETRPEPRHRADARSGSVRSEVVHRVAVRARRRCRTASTPQGMPRLP